MNETTSRSSGFSGTSKGDYPCVPFHVWIEVAVLLALVLVPSFLYSAAYGPVPLSGFNPARLTAAEGPRQAAKWRVVAVGTSMTRCALYWDGDLERLDRESGSSEWSFVRFTLSGGLKDYRRLLRRVLRSRPGVVVLEDALFLLQFGREVDFITRQKQLVKNHQLFLRKMVTSFLYGSRPHSEPPFIPLENWGRRPQEESPRMQGPKDWDLYRSSLMHLKARPLEDAGLVGDFLKQARRCGIRIVFLRIPRSPEAETVFPDSIRRASERVLQQYREVYGVETLRYPQELPMTCYWDFAHMSPEGQRIFSTWFARELTERFRPKGPDHTDGRPIP